MRVSRALVVVAVLVATVPAGWRVWAQPMAGEEGAEGGEARLVALNFADNIDVRVLAKWMSEVTGEVFVYDEAFNGTVSLETPKELPESSLMPLFESVLKLRGYTMVRRADVIMIVSTAKAPALDPSMVFPDGESRSEPGTFVNRLVSLRYADPQAVSEAIEPFLSDPNSVLVLRDRNMLAISDDADNVQRALEIVAHLDQKAARPKVVLVALTHARATEVASQLELAFAKGQKGEAGGAALPIFKPDQRTTSVLVITTENELRAIEAIVATLDTETVEPERLIRIYRLRNTKAESVLTTVGDIIQGGGPTTGAAGPSQTGAGGAPGQDRPGIQVVADQDSNSLIVAATKADHEWIGKLLEDLDQRRPQVLIEAWIVVVNESGAQDLGIEFAATESGGTSTETGTAFGLTGTDEVTGVRGLRLPRDPGLTVGVMNPGDVIAVLHALEQEHKGRILSRPRLLANDNQEATFQSVTEQPYVSTNAITASTSTTSFGGFEEAGTILTITPTIYEDEYLFLDILLVVSSFIGEAPAPESPPPRQENRIETGVTVPNGSTIIIGGIVRAAEVATVDKVPLLGDIPLLGLLFRRKTTSTVKNTLYAFILPQILSAKDFSDLKDISAQSEDAASTMERPEQNAFR